MMGPTFTLGSAASLTRPLAEKNFTPEKSIWHYLSACKILDFLAVIVSEI